MDAQIQELSQYLLDKLACTPSPQRLLVGIAGIPASGKSTFSHLLTQRVNVLLKARDGVAPDGGKGQADESDTQERNETTATQGRKSSTSLDPQEHDQAILVGLDGWHLSRAQLDAFPDPKTAHDRRGIHWTFDAPSYLSFLRSLRSPAPTEPITAPSFDHALKDPTYDAVSIYAHHRIVIIEGLYTFLDIDQWRDTGRMLDERWFVEVDVAEARRRLVHRHVLTGIAEDEEEAARRADLNDLPNGEFIIANMLQPTRTIQSREIPIFSSTYEFVIANTLHPMRITQSIPIRVYSECGTFRGLSK